MATVQTKENGHLQVTFKDGSEAVFKQPTLMHLKQGVALARKDAAGLADVLVKNCLVSGAKDLGSHTGYVKQLIEVSDQIFGKVACELTWVGDDEDLCMVEFADGALLIMNKATRAQYSEAQARGKTNPINAVMYLLDACTTNKEDKYSSSAGHILGFSEVLDDFLDYTGRPLGN